VNAPTAKTVRHPAESRARAEAVDRPGVLAPPPLLYAPALVLGLLLEWAVPLPGMPGALSWPLGTVLVVAGAALGAWFLASFRRARTPVDVRRSTTTVVTDGPFRFTRNPGYLSLTVTYLGITVLADAIWPLALLPVVVFVVQRTVIAREERYLEGKFGDDYLRYKRRTRRWV
jgi:protein-S-isoprenylcysteine O-methyltransferase Ste14